MSIVKALEKRIMEHSLVVEFKKAVATMSDFRWEKPPPGVWWTMLLLLLYMVATNDLGVVCLASSCTLANSTGSAQ